MADFRFAILEQLCNQSDNGLVKAGICGFPLTIRCCGPAMTLLTAQRGRSNRGWTSCRALGLRSMLLLPVRRHRISVR
jgi:hypothetical protein